MIPYKILYFIILCICQVEAFSQIQVFICNKKNIDTTTFSNYRLGGVMRGDACSWNCNQFINVIFDSTTSLKKLYDCKLDSSLILTKPIDKSIIANINLIKEKEGPGKIDRMSKKYTALSGFLIFNGDLSSKENFYAYSRIKSLNIYINEKLIGNIELKDTPYLQYVFFNQFFKIKLKKQLLVRLEIKEIYIGNKNEELHISELHFDGSGGHSLVDRICNLENK